MPMTVSAPAAVARLPSGPGVYRFRDGRGHALYIGRAVNLRRRVRSYWGDLRDRRHLVRMVARVVRVEALACDSEHEAAWVERNLLETQRPHWNRMLGGLETPVFIRLDPRARAPRLDTVHTVEPVRDAVHFGPYLGAVKVRLAVSALQRVFPLAYAADGITGARRDMARVRGVDAADRDAFIAAITAVLRRDEAAVRAVRERLVRQRDEAAANLAFEHAGRLQAECGAIDWIVAEQRAARPEPRDFEAYGWCDGVLVHLRVRGGRLCGWIQRPCGPASARPRLATTPADWIEFARRNADLAVSLARP
jgi:excinuclease ABC subunit C